MTNTLAYNAKEIIVADKKKDFIVKIRKLPFNWDAVDFEGLTKTDKKLGLFENVDFPKSVQSFRVKF